MYKVWKKGQLIRSEEPGMFAGIKTGKIFGRLTCQSGKNKAKKENRVFFDSWQDAIDNGYRPCKLCRPNPNDRYVRNDSGEWELIASLVTVQEVKIQRDVFQDTSRLTLDQVGAEFEWREGEVRVLDYDFENEKIACALTSQLFPFQLFVYREIEKELKASTKSEFEEKAKILHRAFSEYFVTDMPLSVAIWVGCLMGGPILGKRNDIPCDVIEWLVDAALAGNKIWKYEQLYIALAMNESLDPQHLDLLAQIENANIRSRLVANKQTSQETLLYIISRTMGTLMIMALERYDGKIPLEQEARFTTIDGDWAPLASKDISYKSQSLIVSQGSLKEREILFKNPCLDWGLREVLTKYFKTSPLDGNDIDIEL